MTTPSGQISLSQVNAELNLSPTALITMNDAAVRTLAGVGGSGTVISMQNLQNKSNRVAIPLTISGNAYNYDVYSNRGPTYSPGTSDITVTINPGVLVGSTSTGSYAFLVPSSFSPGDTVTVINNGVIQGMGGSGGSGGGTDGNTTQTFPGSPGSSGGNAVFVNRPTTITNNGTLAGGGGGGGGGGGVYVTYPTSPEDFNYRFSTGGGGGGGAGYNGGSGGSAGAHTPGIYTPGGSAIGNGGSSGTSPAGGGGGPGTAIGPGAPQTTATGGSGGSGGGRGGSGSSGSPGTPGPNPVGKPGGSGGSPGAYIVGNPFVTYPATGTRLGPSS